MSYEKLSDAVEVSRQNGLSEGETEIWYMREESWNNSLSMGYDYLEEKGKLPDPEHLSETHILLGKIKEEDLEHIFQLMQGEIWSPDGEANGLIYRKKLVHTSMSVGDIVVVKGRVMFVDSFGFRELE